MLTNDVIEAVNVVDISNVMIIISLSVPKLAIKTKLDWIRNETFSFEHNALIVLAVV